MLDGVISVIIWLYQNTFLRFPTEIGYLPIATFTGTLEAVKPNLIYALSGINGFIPINFLVGAFIAVLLAEGALLSFKIIVFVVNLFRGAGA
jgi:hypothetical protein